MYSYVTKELPDVVSGLFPVDVSRASICGHSMGGHGALVCHLKNPGKYRSVSAFSPITNPTDCPWGHKAFTVSIYVVSYLVESTLPNSDFNNRAIWAASTPARRTMPLNSWARTRGLRHPSSSIR